MSSVLGGFVMLKGRVIAAVAQLSTPPFITLLAEGTQFRVHFYPDTSDDVLIGERRIAYVPYNLSCTEDENEVVTPMVIYIVLVEVDRKPGDEIQYRGIGGFSIHGQDEINRLCPKGEDQVFKLV